MRLNHENGNSVVDAIFIQHIVGKNAIHETEISSLPPDGYAGAVSAVATATVFFIRPGRVMVLMCLSVCLSPPVIQKSPIVQRSPIIRKSTIIQNSTII